MKIYLLPGLGFDHRIFARLDLGGLDVEYINWIEPKANEPIRDYAKRLAASIDDRGVPVILIGYSFGGIVSQEIAALKKIEKIILLSSIKSREELPFLFKIIKPLRIHKVFTKEFSRKTVQYWGKNHGFEAAATQDLFKSMVGGYSNNYLQWALEALSGWSPPEVPISTSIFQIHGAADKTFPITRIRKPDRIIENGGHIMVYNQPRVISDILREEIENAGRQHAPNQN